MEPTQIFRPSRSDGRRWQQTGENSMNIILNPAALDKKNEFGSAEVMLSMLAATNMTAKKEGASDMELFISNNNY